MPSGPWGATLSAQVIRLPTWPSGEPFLTHPLPAGGTPPGSKGSEPCPYPASPFCHSAVGVAFVDMRLARVCAWILLHPCRLHAGSHTSWLVRQFM